MAMTIRAKLLARKQKLLERLEEDPGRHESDEIARQIEQIDTALSLLEESRSVKDGEDSESG
jgi:hypothetical protein